MLTFIKQIYVTELRLVGWLVFNSIFSTKKLYHAIEEKCVKTVVTG